MTLTASELRANLYRVLDRALGTGETVEVEHKGRRLLIVPADEPDRLRRLVDRTNHVLGDSEDFVRVDWSKAWHG